MTERKRRVLILSQWFDPEPTFKGALFAQYLVDQGLDVRVLTGFPNYPGGKLYPGYRVRLIQHETVGDIRVTRVPLYPSHDGSAARRVANYASFAMSAAIAALFIKRPDVVYVYHPPATIALPAVMLKWVRGVPFVYDVQDLWPDTLASTGMLSRRTALRSIGWAMRRTYRSAARVAVLSKGFKAALVERGVPEEKVVVIPNWADEKAISVPSPRNAPSTQDAARKFVVTFAGNLGAAQQLDTVLSAAEILKDRSEVLFQIIGGGIASDALEQQIELRRISNVVLMPRVPISSIGEILADSDALLVHLRDDPLFAITIPSKTQAYLRVGRPVLMGVRGDAADMINDAGAGLTFDPGDAQSLADAVSNLMSRPLAELVEMGRAGSSYYDNELSLAVGGATFTKVLLDASYLRPRYLFVKRFLDVVLAAIGLLLTALPMAVVALLVRVKLGSPVIFTQERPGRFGQTFLIRKFRTMTDQRDSAGDSLPDDQRLTAFGRFLRTSSLDELPELWNVLVGDMSIVGPRPLLMRYSQYFRPAERLRLHVRPGITGLAQISGRNLVSWDERLGLDVEYVQSMSVKKDIAIIWMTIMKVLSRQDVVPAADLVMDNLDVERTKSGG